MKESYESVGKWISVIDRHTQMYVSRSLRHFGVGAGQLPFLIRLYKIDGVSQDYLAKELVVDKATVTRAVQSLEESGLITRRPCESDRRKNLVFLTEKARAAKEEIERAMQSWTGILTKNISEEEKTVLLSLLKRAAGNAMEDTSAREHTD
ncbi:MAG: MarR family transcriptional regulator [Gorillibacterium sp.]|nr:MarR family transcriptional regulator [Gorillibacterium sp.]